MSHQRLIYSTVLSDDFVPGFCTLLHSIRKHSPDFENEFRVIYHERWAPLSIAWRVVLEEVYPNVKFVRAGETQLLEMIERNVEITSEPRRFYGAFLKLFAFGFHDADQIVFLDSDTLCFGGLDELSLSSSGFRACSGWDLRKPKPFNFFNSGVMVLGKVYLNSDFYQKLTRFRLPDNFDRRLGLNDQAVLNYLIPFADVELLPDSYNVTRRLLSDDVFDDAWEKLQPRVIHYVAKKPWQMGEGESNYSAVDALWWQHYDEFFRLFPKQDAFRLRVSAGSVSPFVARDPKLSIKEKDEQVAPVEMLGKRMPFKKDKWMESLRFWNLKRSGSFLTSGVDMKPATFEDGRLAIATVIDFGYLEGCEVLLHSLKGKNPDLNFDFVVFTRGDIPAYQLESLRELHSNVLFREIKESNYGEIEAHPRLGRTSFYVFEVFSLAEYDRVIYMDSDILCQKGISGLVSSSSDFAAVLNVGNSLYAEKLWDSDRPVFNSGVMSIGKSYLKKEITRELISLATVDVGKDDPVISRFADQRVLNYFFKDKHVDFLPLNFNGLTKLSRIIGEREMKHIALLHYTGVKPWQYLHRREDFSDITVSVDKLMRKWGRTQKEFRSRLRAFQFTESGEFEKWESLKAKQTSDRCFILGNGPSLQSQDLKLLRHEFTIVSNWFGLHPQYDEIAPDLYTIASHTVFGGWRAEQTELNHKFHRMLLGASRHTPKVFSYNFKEYIESENLFPMQDLYYLIYEKPLKKHIDAVEGLQFDPRLPLVEADTVVLTFSVMIAVYLGFKEIYLLGCDCNYVDSSDKASKHRYFYNISEHSTQTSSSEHISKVWGDNGRIFRAYEKTLSSCQAAGVKIYNATDGGKLEVLPRKSFESLF